MGKTTYKVWIDIEAYDEETDEGTLLDAPRASVAVFNTYRKAWAFAERLHAMGEREGAAPARPRRRSVSRG